MFGGQGKVERLMACELCLKGWEALQQVERREQGMPSSGRRSRGEAAGMISEESAGQCDGCSGVQRGAWRIRPKHLRS